MVPPPRHQQDVVQLHTLQYKHQCKAEGNETLDEVAAITERLHGGLTVMAQHISSRCCVQSCGICSNWKTWSSDVSAHK